jgi:hypothetical protein
MRQSLEAIRHLEESVDVTFSALLEQLGPGNQTPDGTHCKFHFILLMFSQNGR